MKTTGRFHAKGLPGALLLSAVLVATAGHAAPYVPARDDEIIERLPAVGVRVPAPADPAAAAELARRYVELGREQGDPRFHGYAQSVLAPWWAQPQPPLEIWILRAVLRQSRHEFDLALADLDRIVKLYPRHPQAWLSRALLLRVRGDYAGALRDCRALLALDRPLLAVACAGSVSGLQGRAEESYRLLSRWLELRPPADPAEGHWAQAVLAELAARRGDTAAEGHFRAALAGGENAYVLGAYADFLLDQGRPEAVRALLKDRVLNTGLLLRLALAEQALGAPDLAERRRLLEEDFAAARRRGDGDLRDAARLLLHLLQRPDAALDLALRNWAMQREPWDARLVLEAALAADNPAAAGPVVEWLKDTGLEDARLAALMRRIEGRRP